MDDLDNDGDQDLATAGKGSHLDVLEGRGNGFFPTGTQYAAGPQPAGVTAGDFNRDGAIDLAVSNHENFSGQGNTVSILMGNGDGTFQPPVAYAVYFQPGSVAVADFDRDGFLDVVAANYAGDLGSVSVLLGNGDGTFQPAIDSPAGYSPDEIVVADFNRDRHPDVAVENNKINDPALSILLGRGDGTFAAPVEYGLEGWPEGMAVEDFNRDGYIDLAVGQRAWVSVFLGNGDGTLQPGVKQHVPPLQLSVAASDLNSDGHPDLVAGSENERMILNIVPGNGDGSFQTTKVLRLNAVPIQLAAGDLDAGPHKDVIVAGFWAVSVLFDLAMTSGATPVDYSAGDDVGDAIIADVDGDNDLDLIVLNRTGQLLSGQDTGTVTVLINDSHRGRLVTKNLANSIARPTPALPSCPAAHDVLWKPLRERQTSETDQDLGVAALREMSGLPRRVSSACRFYARVRKADTAAGFNALAHWDLEKEVSEDPAES
jgi:hypothetical protein